MIGRKDFYPSWLVTGAIVLFLVHAANYLYFFVDDEAIPFVYAQNVLKGNGLIYNSLEGRLEGYSDFLHVLWSTVILGVVRSLPIPKYSVFFVGKGFSLLCGIGILLLVGALTQRTMRRVGAITALGTLALAAPLALWSCSSLEAVPVALMAIGLIAALVLARDGWAAIAAALLILERIDGFVFAGLLVGGFLLTATGTRRRDMIRHIVLPVSAVFLVYHGWRWWYFRDFIPAPVEAKILYKLLPQQHVVTKRPIRPYALEFIVAYGWPAALGLAAAALHGLTTRGWIRALVIAALPLAAYVSIVGDWMFGFRFFVPLLPVFALIVGNAVDRIAAVRPRLAAVACVTSLVYSAVIAARFSETYVRAEETPSFFHSASLDLHRFFWPYYGLYESTRGLIPPGAIVAYNQAGFVPFMLDVNNIDDLGICSRFPAEIPSTDIFFTEVGRYAPLTNKRTLRPVHAYLLYQNVQFVLSRTDILERANHGTVPSALFGGMYQLVATDRNGLNAIYKRDETAPVRVTADLFTENVAHVSYARKVQIGESTIDPSDYLPQLPFLRDAAGSIPFSRRAEMMIEFSDVGERVAEISIEHLRASVDATVQVRLLTPEAHVAGETQIALPAGRDRSVSFATPNAATNRVTLTIDAGEASGELWIDDFRLMGQRHALRRYVLAHLQFPPEQERGY